jgi:4-hydroxybenzoate polyprenyltransferase
MNAEYPIRYKLVRLKPYIRIARPDHWFKNIFMLLGILLAFFIEPSLAGEPWLPAILAATAVSCLVASSNYVINEILDAPKDALHPTKCNRPVACGLVSVPIAYGQWFILAACGIGLASSLNRPLGLTAAAFWLAGLAYNVPPVRTKDIVYLDVLSESLNNPIRLFIGWFALVPDQVPPISLTISYWMVGAFFMAAKRLGEIRMIANRQRAASYRNSFRHYTEERIIISMVFYSTFCSFFFGIFIIRYHLELLLVCPMMAGFFAAFLKVTFKKNSPVQTPEKLYKETKLMLFMAVGILFFVVLLYSEIPFLYRLFNVVPYKITPLWSF